MAALDDGIAGLSIGLALLCVCFIYEKCNFIHHTKLCSVGQAKNTHSYSLLCTFTKERKHNLLMSKRAPLPQSLDGCAQDANEEREASRSGQGLPALGGNVSIPYCHRHISMGHGAWALTHVVTSSAADNLFYFFKINLPWPQSPLQFNYLY